MPADPTKLKPGDELTTGFLNGLLAMIRRATVNLGINSGLSMVQNDAGTFLRLANVSGGPIQVAVTNGTITARSGTTPGAGNVHLADYDGTILVVDTSEDVPVLYISSTTGGIPTGIYVQIAQDAAGNNWIVSVDCGN